MSRKAFPFTVTIGGQDFVFRRPPGQKLTRRVNANPGDAELMYRAVRAMLGSTEDADRLFDATDLVTVARILHDYLPHKKAPSA